MVRIKPREVLKKRYQDAVRFVPARYKEGIQAVTGWKESALAGQKVYEEKMSNPEVLARRAKAIERIEEAEWKKNALELGAKRIGEGMAKKVDKWDREWAPYHDVLASLELPARSADPMENVDNRVKAVVKALVDKKKEIKG